MSIEVGTKLQGKVTGITKFGAFVQLSDGVTGLVHISEIADNYVKDVNDHLKLEDTVTVKVINVDKNGKIGLSIKQASDKPASGGHRKGGRRPYKPRPNALSFEEKMSRFLKDSEERMSSLKKNTESKRGGRGAKRL